MQNRHITLVVPKLAAWFANQHPVVLPALPTLLARARASQIISPSDEALFFALFGLPVSEELPIAAITGLADGVETQCGYWLRADPVQLQADLAAVYLLGNEHVALTKDDIDPVLEKCQKLLGHALQVPDPKRWYLSLDHDPEIKTYVPNAVIGKNITNYLPAGNKATHWRKLQTELQMLLYQQADLQAKGITGIWLWGAGQLPKPSKANWRQVWTDNLIVKGLSLLANIPVSDQLEFCFQKMEAGEYLIVLDEFMHLDELLEDLLVALRARDISSLTLYLGNHYSYQVTAKSIRYFWKRPRLLDHYFKLGNN